MCRASHSRVVVQYAIGSRVLIISLMILWRSIVSPYDTSASINPSCLTTPLNNSNAPRIGDAIERSIVWDGVYFVRIAQCGYEYEQTYAFLPLLPIIISFMSRTVLAPLIPLIGYRAVLGLSGYLLNNFAFVLAAFYFYRLSVLILKDTEVSLRASILFCLNPASIFYSSIYTESLYALLCIGGSYHFIRGATNYSTLWFALSGCVRSNGVLNAGYICYQTMHSAYDAIFLKKCGYLALRVLVAGALRCLCIVVPFISFQAYGYYNLCLGHTSEDLRPWCKARIPLLYNFIQNHYWGVGFLTYFQVKQLPNFLLASPILFLSLCTVVHYVELWPEVFLSLGFRASFVDRSFSRVRATADILQSENFNLSDGQPLRRKRKIVEENPKLESVTIPADRFAYTPTIILPFVVHLVFMTATAFFVMHVQVATRFLSASPPLYWFASYIMGHTSTGKRWGYIIWMYCASYIFLGSLLFSNFYPFT
ncbi:hypothetical protein Leryth_003972 [Lithospermum erythrorhizon]|nr:hypothetical protein Leryth_003972 [Lithospermum erythrorhizon]